MGNLFSLLLDNGKSPAGRNQLGELHPLQNPVVLTHLFVQCPPALLSKLRLVCRDWHDLSLETWRSTVCFKLDYFQEELYLSLNPRTETSLTEFLTYLEAPENQCSTKPFCKFHFYICPFDRVPAERLAKFWELAGKQITSLKLSYCTFQRYIIFFCWDELFIHFRLVRQITLSISREHNRRLDGFPILTLVEVLRAIKASKLHHGGFKMPITHFEILPHFDILHGHPLYDQVIQLFQELQIPLRSFKVWLRPPHIPDQFGVYWQGLRKLTYFDGLGPHRWSFPFQQTLENLQELVLENVHWENMEFLKLLPNLRTLEIRDNDFKGLRFPYPDKPTTMISDTCKQAMLDVKLLHLEKLILDFVITDEDLKCLIGWLPNVKRLRMALNNEQLVIICREWTGLKVLEIMGNELTDEGVIGMEICEEGYLYMSRGLVWEREGVPPPTIAMLKNLTDLTCLSEKLTEASLYFGFIRMDSLEYVRLIVLGRLSRDAKRRLKGKIEQLSSYPTREEAIRDSFLYLTNG